MQNKTENCKATRKSNQLPVKKLVAHIHFTNINPYNIGAKTMLCMHQKYKYKMTQILLQGILVEQAYKYRIIIQCKSVKTIHERERN